MLSAPSLVFGPLLPVLIGGVPSAGHGVPVLSLDVVAERGDPAPGAPAGATFGKFGIDADQLGFINTTPSIDRDGVVGFFTHLDGIGGGPTIFDGIPGGLFRGVPGDVDKIAVDGDPANGTSDAFTGFPGIGGVAPSLTSGAATFSATVPHPSGVGELFGVWSDRNGFIELVAIQGLAAPGTGSLFKVPGFLATDAAVIVAAEYNGGLADEGLWRFDANGLAPIVVNDQAAPGLPGVSFGDDSGNAGFPTVTRFGVSRHGHVAFASHMDGAGVNGNNDEAIWVDVGAGPTLFLREGDPAFAIELGLGSRFGNSTGFKSIQDVSQTPVTLASNGALLFGAEVFDPAVGAYNAVWTDRSGLLELIALGTLGGGNSPDGTPPPGYPAGRRFLAFGDGRINNAGHLVIRGVVDDPQNIFHSFSGIWWDRDGTLELVAGDDTPVPAMPGFTFQDLGGFDLSESGWVVFTSTVSGPGVDASNDGALFLVDPTGEHHVLMREGDVVDLAGDGSDLRTIAAFFTGAQLSDDLSVALEMEFTDGSEAIVRADVDGIATSLTAEHLTISAATGGLVPFTLTGGLENAGRPYLLLGSLSLASPPLTLPGGASLPITLDAFASFVAQNVNGVVFQDFFGSLDEAGVAGALLSPPAPLPAGLVGLTMHFAWFTPTFTNVASNPLSVTIVP